MAGRTLHVRCATWDQVEVFTVRKLRKGRMLSMKVPFNAAVGTPVTLGLELPNGLVMAIDGVVQKASPVEVDGKIEAGRMWIEVDLVGFTDEVKARLAQLSKQDAKPEEVVVQPAAPVRRPTHSDTGDNLPDDERALFQHLTAELRRLRQAAVHEVLGVSRDAGPTDVRRAWKDLIRKNHPDLVARRQAPAISHLAEELTILANRAYDRMRGQLVAQGRGAIAGPAIATPPGWLVGFDDIHSGDGAPPPRRPGRPERSDRSSGSNPAIRTDRSSGSNPGIEPPPEPKRPASAGTGQGSDAFEQRARASLGAGDIDTAREVLAAALVVYPRSKPLRSLYYVATALAALADGEVMLATTQLETALAHHEQCVEAIKVLEHVKKHGTQRPEEMRRFFR
jgi:hypothetical protein